MICRVLHQQQTDSPAHHRVRRESSGEFTNGSLLTSFTLSREPTSKAIYRSIEKCSEVSELACDVLTITNHQLYPLAIPHLA